MGFDTFEINLIEFQILYIIYIQIKQNTSQIHFNSLSLVTSSLDATGGKDSNPPTRRPSLRSHSQRTQDAVHLPEVRLDQVLEDLVYALPGIILGSVHLLLDHLI